MQNYISAINLKKLVEYCLKAVNLKTPCMLSIIS